MAVLGLTRDVRLQIQQCEVYRASKHGRPMETMGPRWLYAGRPWQIVAGEPSRTYGVFYQRKYLDTGAHGPLHLVG